MIYTVAKEVVYIPEWDGNKKKKEKEQVKIIIQLPSANEIANSYLNKTGDSAVMNEFLLYVKRVENLEISNGVTVKKATPKDIMHTKGMSELWAEIKNFYIEYKTVDKKK